MNRILFLLIFTVLIGCSPENDAEDELLVFAAASLANTISEIKDAFELQHKVRVSVNYGGSQLLAQQISSGAPADVFLSAGKFPMNFLEKRTLIDPNWSDLLTNELVLTSPASNSINFTSLMDLASPNIRQVAIANPKLAPAGRYAQESLTSAGLWNLLQPKLVFASDVRATLAFVESGNAEAGMVYLTDARLAQNIAISYIIPHNSHSLISYPVAIVARSQVKLIASDFIEFLKGHEAGEIFVKHGFKMAQ